MLAKYISVLAERCSCKAIAIVCRFSSIGQKGRCRIEGEIYDRGGETMVLQNVSCTNENCFKYIILSLKRRITKQLFVTLVFYYLLHDNNVQCQKFKTYLDMISWTRYSQSRLKCLQRKYCVSIIVSTLTTFEIYDTYHSIQINLNKQPMKA